jgi:hypothetical protein
MRVFVLFSSLALATATVQVAACGAPEPGEPPSPSSTTLERIGAVVATPQTLAFDRIDTSEDTLVLASHVDVGGPWRLRLELTPDLRADGVQAVVDRWGEDRPVAIDWEGTFEHLTPEGAAVDVPVELVAETALDPQVRTLCGETQRVRARAWITVDGVRAKALVTLGVVDVRDVKDRGAFIDAMAAPGNCQIHATWYSGWTYSWCTNAADETSVSCTFVQQTSTTSSEICLQGTVAGGVGSGGGITIGGGGGSGTATGTWGTVTNLVYATFPGECVHVDGWFSDYCECRATGAPSYSIIPVGCSGGSGGTCSSPTSCPAGG